MEINKYTILKENIIKKKIIIKIKLKSFWISKIK